jgi:signal transduction histidine kinase
VEILLEQTEASAIIKVRNKGPLLPCRPEILFGPFASIRSGSSSEHQGLGLYLVRLIADVTGATGLRIIRAILAGERIRVRAVTRSVQRIPRQGICLRRQD